LSIEICIGSYQGAEALNLKVGITQCLARLFKRFEHRDRTATIIVRVRTFAAQQCSQIWLCSPLVIEMPLNGYRRASQNSNRIAKGGLLTGSCAIYQLGRLAELNQALEHCIQRGHPDPASHQDIRRPGFVQYEIITRGGNRNDSTNPQLLMNITRSAPAVSVVKYTNYIALAIVLRVT